MRQTKADVSQATLLEGSRTGSGAGPQMYAEKIGRCSVRSPRDMTIPIGSSFSFISRIFFIVLSMVAYPIMFRVAPFKALLMPRAINKLSLYLATSYVEAWPRCHTGLSCYDTLF